MSPIEVIYENGVFRPLQPVELPEGAEGAVVIRAVVGAESEAAVAPDHAHAPHQSPVDDTNGASNANGASASDSVADPRVAEHAAESPGQRAYRLLMEVAALPHAEAPNGRTDIGVQHDSILYPKQGRML